MCAGSDYYHPGPLSEADRQTVNQWISRQGHFDAVIDFDAVVRDPEHPDRLLPAYDCGDDLHPWACWIQSDERCGSAQPVRKITAARVRRGNQSPEEVHYQEKTG